MKKQIIVGGAAALVLAAAFGAVAQQAGSRGDADGDGRVSQAEFVQARLDRLRTTDADADGTVSAEERQAGGVARQAERADRRFARMDANGDGSITRAEFDAAAAARPERARGPHRGRDGAERAERGPVVIADVEARMGQRFARMDKDSNGFVTAEERQATRQERRMRRDQTSSSPQAPVTE